MGAWEFIVFFFLLSYMFESLHNKKLKINQYKIFSGKSTVYHVEDPWETRFFVSRDLLLDPQLRQLSLSDFHEDPLPAWEQSFLASPNSSNLELKALTAIHILILNSPTTKLTVPEKLLMEMTKLPPAITLYFLIPD